MFSALLSLAAGDGRVYVCAVKSCTVTPARHWHAKQLLAFIVRSRTRALAANVSNARPSMLGVNRVIIPFALLKGRATKRIAVTPQK